MKLSTLFTIIFVLLHCISIAQKKTNWGAFNQKMEIQSFAGKNFKIQASVKIDRIDSMSKCGIWARVDKKNGKNGFFDNMEERPIKSDKWHTYTISGKIAKDAKYLFFGGLYYNKGVFYYDDFKLSIESETGKYENIVIPNGDFEMDSLKNNWEYYQKREGFTLGLTKESFTSGTQSCRIDGSKYMKPKTFGNYDSLGKYAFVNGTRLYYETYGKGEPLLLLHGNSMSIESFRLQIPELSKYYMVIAIDTRGQGKSSEDGKQYSYDLFADDMDALLNDLKIDSVNILGWSDGGNTGLIMAMKYPKKVRRLVTMGANVFIDNTVVKKSVFREIDDALKYFKNDTTVNGINRKRLMTLLKTEPNHSFEDLKLISCPVLVIAGEKDIIREEHTKGIASNIKNGVLLIEPKVTHEFPWENPTVFNKKVLDFLKK
jgi:pimeloyl-ACP methyl ester carboxylesterase